MITIYEDFVDIEEEVRSKVPPITYKFRDWSNPFHQKILIEKEVWFSHPKDLNDPYDVRVPVTFDYSEVDHPYFLDKLKYYTKVQFPFINPYSREFSVVVENQLDIIKGNIGKYFEENYEQIRESDLYDPIGVLSLSATCLDETMWAHYGNNGKGFAIGFDTVELARELKVKFGVVDYNDQPPLHSFLRDIEDNIQDETFLKHTKWRNEREFRFLTYAIEKDSDRTRSFCLNAVKEIVLGPNIPNKHRDEIIAALKKMYNNKVRLFRVKESSSHFGFDKLEVAY